MPVIVVVPIVVGTIGVAGSTFLPLLGQLFGLCNGRIGDLVVVVDDRAGS